MRICITNRYWDLHNGRCVVGWCHVMLKGIVMGKTNAQRQADYRASKKRKRLCARPGCGNKAAPFVHCSECRQKAKLTARGRTLTLVQQAEADRDHWRSEYSAMFNEYRKLAEDWYELTESVLDHNCYAVQDAKNNCSLRDKCGYGPAARAGQADEGGHPSDSRPHE